MGKSDYFAAGQWNVVCDQCGKKFKSSQIRRQWDGLYVCRKCHDPRHPQDFVKGVVDDQSVPYSRPQTDATFTAEATALTVTE